jgi:hypothetical protein
MGWAGHVEKWIQKYWDKLKGGVHPEDIGMDGRIILERIFEK